MDWIPRSSFRQRESIELYQDPQFWILIQESIGDNYYNSRLAIICISNSLVDYLSLEWPSCQLFWELMHFILGFIETWPMRFTWFSRNISEEMNHQEVKWNTSKAQSLYWLSQNENCKSPAEKLLLGNFSL